MSWLLGWFQSDYKLTLVFIILLIRHVIHFQKSDQGTPIGYMYEFDCKSQIGTEESGWLSVAFEHRVIYSHLLLTSALYKQKKAKENEFAIRCINTYNKTKLKN